MQNNLLRLLSLALLAALSSSCTRASSDKSTIVFQVLSGSEKATPFVTVDTDYTKEPLNLDEINCFYVVAAGPEDSMSGLKCGTKNPDQSLAEVFRGGFIIGGVKRTLATDKVEIEAEVPQGPARHFYLLGVKRQDNVDCFSMGERTTFDGASTTSVRSNVYIIGHTDPTTLVGGATTNIPVTMGLDGESWIDQCQRTPGTIVPADPSGGATQLFLTKSSLPSGARAVAGKCQPFEFELRNNLGKLAASTQTVSVKLEMSPDDDSNLQVDTFTTASTYETFANCNNAASAQSSFYFAAGTTQVLRWVHTPAKVAGVTETQSKMFLRMTPSLATIMPAHFSNSVQAYGTVANIAAATSGYNLLGPRLVVSNQCYEYRVALSSATGASISLNNKPYRFSNYGSNNNKAYAVYSDASCTSEITTESNVSSESIYVKFLKSQGDGRAQLVVSPNSGGDQYSLTYIDVMTIGENVVAGVDAFGPKVIPPTTCSKFMVSLVNQYGASVTNTAATATTATITGGTVLYSDATCSNTAAGSLTVTIPVGKQGGVFYVKAASSGSLSLESSGLTKSIGYLVENFVQ